jgi:hypothetical protein
MISAQMRSAFVARENRYTLFRIMHWSFDAFSSREPVSTSLENALKDQAPFKGA